MDHERRPRGPWPYATLAFVGAVLAACDGDGGPTDTGIACTLGGGVNGWIDDPAPPVPGGVEVAGAATVLDHPTLALRFDDGAAHRVGYELPGDDAQVFLPGERVWAELSARGPFWVNYQVELYALAAGGGPGELRLAVWWGEDRMGPVRGWGLTHEDSDCEAIDDGCGLAVSRSLRVAAPGGGQALVAPGTSVDLEGYRVANGRSLRYGSELRCTDTPLTWSGGGLVRL